MKTVRSFVLYDTGCEKKAMCDKSLTNVLKPQIVRFYHDFVYQLPVVNTFLFVRIF